MTKPRLLIVEDEPITRFMMSEICDQLGYTYVSASSGLQCLEMMLQSPPCADIILMDIHMPDLSGVEACARLREAGSRPAPTIIAVTADEFWQNPAHSEAAGFDGVLAKPISMRSLKKTLQSAVPPEQNCPA